MGAGMGVGAVAVVLLIFVGMVCLIRRKSKSRSQTTSTSISAKPAPKSPKDTYTRGSQKSFATSAFRRMYREPDSAPRWHHQLEAAVDALVQAYAKRNGLSLAAGQAFFATLRTNALASAIGGGDSAELLQADQLKFIAVRLWTSAAKLGEREFCSILNDAIRDDDSATIGHAVTIAHALNNFCVTRRHDSATPTAWPSSNITFRGTAMPRCHRAFFTKGKKYRAPMFLATSVREDVSVDSFLMRLAPPNDDQTPPSQEPVLWRFHLDGTLPQNRRCLQANFIGRTDGTANEEHEFLYSPYSAFTVRAVHWEAEPCVNTYERRFHTIDIDVAPDNLREPDDLPLAPWC